MKRSFLQKIGLAFGIFCLVGCSFPPIQLTDEGRQVQLFFQPEEFPQCFVVGEFKAMALAARGSSYQQALKKIKNKVAIYEGNHLKINTSDTNELVTVITGIGYRCPITDDGAIEETRLNPTLF